MPAERTYVPNMSPSALITADELLHLQIPDKQVELVRGVLVVKEPPGYLHGEITARVTNVLMNYTNAHDLGRVLAGDAGFKLATNPDTVRGPDVAFIRRERLPHPSPAGYAAFSPDLVVEVLSPRDRPGDVLAKVADWLSAGTRLVWVVDPERRVARIYRADPGSPAPWQPPSVAGQSPRSLGGAVVEVGSTSSHASGAPSEPCGASSSARRVDRMCPMG